ncbi:uncharacterized protein LY79DRAFT_136313 [Colletotrichum navitas]|uniref:Protein BTN n=1 Tax=Colletotrichum navitas TaxID=681940 RepID=A0AAD8PJR7_9PEZI|nr:uncharacterized protein LY79DRAFT_136313 [Colletotrichum navitas]KAK1564270.1 hypothetical protein LY79DRAFT_136313 [Colletotrichum navitas]
MNDVIQLALEPNTAGREFGKPAQKGAHHVQPLQDPMLPLNVVTKPKINWRVVIAFFFLGLLIAMPSAVITTGANVMFTGFTGVYEVCASLTGAIISVGTPFVARFIPYDVCTVICTASTALAYLIPTLPHVLEGGATPNNKAAPIIGTMFGGFVYAFGTNIYMAVAAFFPPEAVLALSVGSGCAIILGPGLYTAFMVGLNNDWRRTFLVFLSTTILIPIVWWIVTDPGCRAAAEKSRIESLTGTRRRSDNTDNGSDSTEPQEAITCSVGGPIENYQPAFGKHRSRVVFLIKTILPKYVLPLIFCTSSAIVTLLGTGPTLQELETFRDAPDGDMQFQLAFLSYGAAQFLFSTLSSLRPSPHIWVWTGIQIAVMAIGLMQFAYPFLKYYGVWVFVLFLTGACVGSGVTNTNFKIGEDFRKTGEPDEVRSFAMSFAGVGNFGGDALGGALGVMVQQIATKALRRTQ